jgi:hypothetical protein
LSLIFEALTSLTSVLTAERVYILAPLYPKMAYFFKNRKIWHHILSALCAVLPRFADFRVSLPTMRPLD